MKIKILIFLFLIGSFFFLRLYKIGERVNFSMDQGIFLSRSWEIYKNKEITLIGPTASPVVHGRHFFQGPGIYYSLVFLMMLSNWNVVAASYFLVFFNFLSVAVLYLVGEKMFNKKVGLIATSIYIFLPITIHFSNFIWNPNILLTLVPFFIFLGVKSFENKKWWNYLIWGILGGICFQFHFQFFLILLFTLIFLIFKKQNWKNIILYISGIILGYSPLLIFDLRNNFYNIKTILEWLRYGNDGKFGFEDYYILSFVPFFCLGLAWVLNKLKNKIILILLMIFLIVYSGFYFVKINQKGALGMAKDWSYPLEKQTVKEILKDGCPKNFEVASMINGDTVAYPLRYLLEVEGCNPMGVDEYSKAEKLFIVTPNNRSLEKETVWEVVNIGKFNIDKKILLNDKISLYEFKIK